MCSKNHLNIIIESEIYSFEIILLSYQIKPYSIMLKWNVTQSKNSSLFKGMSS
jgi:hypothetical protein